MMYSITKGQPLAYRKAIGGGPGFLLHAPTLRDAVSGAYVDISSASPTPGLGGLGIRISGGSQLAQGNAVPFSVSSDADFTVEILLSMTAAPALCQVFGLFGTIGGGVVSSAGGQSRGILAFGGGSNLNIYFWGESADLASGVDFRTDGSVQHVFVVRRGTSMRFFRDGWEIASGATPTLSSAASPMFPVIGGRHASGSTSPTMTVYKAAYYARALTNGEIGARTTNPWLDFAILSTFEKATPTAPLGVFPPFPRREPSTQLRM